MHRLSRHASRSPVSADEHPPVLYSFPQLASVSQEDLPQKQSLHQLLDHNEPSMFDRGGALDENDPQALSNASDELLRGIVEHRGAVDLVRRLSSLLAERDAHITALTRLAEEYKIPAERISDSASRAKRAERRRLSLSIASEDLDVPSGLPSGSSTSQESDMLPIERHASAGGTIRGLTRLFGGNQTLRPSRRSPASSRSDSRPPNRAGRSTSLDVRSIQSAQSVQSAESVGWKDAAGNLFKSAPKRQDSHRTREPVEMTTRHDPDQLPPTLAQHTADPQEAAWNKFILHLMKIRQQNGDYDGTLGLIGASKFGHEGQDGRQRMLALMRLVIEGVPLQMRHSIWMELSNVDSIVQPQAFSRYLEMGESHDAGEREAILKDVPRTLTSKYDFYAEKGFARLKEVLVAFVGKYKELGYTQGLNSVAGYLLLTIPVQEDAFWMLCNLVDNFFPAHYFSGRYAMEAPQADNSLLRNYVRQLMPQLAQHLDELNIPVTHTVPMKWFFTAFANVVSETLLMRIWDVWLCLPNQKHFLINVALMLLIYNHNDLMACESDSACYAHLDNMLKYPEEPEQMTRFIRDAVALSKKLDDLDEKRSQSLKWRLKRVGSVEVLMDEPLEDAERPRSASQ